MAENEKGVKYCARYFTLQQLNSIRQIIKSKKKITRYEISRLVCKTLGWYKHNGGLKDMSCRVALLRMERDGLIKLPPPRIRNVNGKTKIEISSVSDPKPLITQSVGLLGKLDVILVSGKKESSLWNEYIERYHYLKYKRLPGAQLRYFIRIKEETIALLGFGASAWAVAPRDQFIGWTSEQRKRNLHLIINNARFLILPWVKSKNLASKILSLIAKRLTNDWQEKYNYQPVLLETFVERNKFLGTCYKASNWIYIGITKGRGKLDVKNKYSLPKKDIWIFPLAKNFKHALCS